VPALLGRRPDGSIPVERPAARGPFLFEFSQELIMKFVDEATIDVAAGDGGNGCA